MKLVLGHHKWATLVWPVVEQCEDDHGVRQLSLASGILEGAGASWMFITNPNDFQAFPSSTIWSYEFGVAFQTTASEPLLVNSLRKPMAFTYGQLLVIAGFLRVANAHRLKRADLLKCMAGIVGGGDAHYIDEVLAADRKVKSPVDESGRTDLVEHVLDSMDPSEKDEFDDLKKDIKAVKNQSKANAWKKWRDEKKEEAEDSCFWVDQTFRGYSTNGLR